MFLTPEQTGGPRIFSLRDCNRYLAVDMVQEFEFERPGSSTNARPGITERLIWHVREFDIEQLAQALGQAAGETWQEHRSLILLACMDGRLFELLDVKGGNDVSNQAL